MRWIVIGTTILGAAAISFGSGVAPTDVVRCVNDTFVLTSARPPKDCQPVPLATPPAGKEGSAGSADMKEKATTTSKTKGGPAGTKTKASGRGTKSVSAIAGGTPAVNKSEAGGDLSAATDPTKPAGGDAAQYTITPSPACIKALSLPVATKHSDDAYYTSDSTRLAGIHVFGASGEVDLNSKAPEQGPLVLVDEKQNVYRLDSTTKQTRDAGTSKRIVRPCTDAAYKGRSADVEIDLVDGASIRKTPPRNVIQPNQGLVVLVCQDPEKDLYVDWGGTPGLTRAEQPASEKDGANLSETIDRDWDTEGSTEKVTYVDPKIVRLAFSPRTAGVANLQVWESAKGSGDPNLKVELQVEPLYWGAVRFGLGTLFGDWNTYSVVTASGSHTSEVREDTQGATFELVSAFALYALDDALYGGRSQTGGHNLHIAPYLGFGVIGANPTTGVQGLTSFHAGLEWEIADNLSVAFTFVYRRTKKLASDYEPGSPVAAGMTIDNITVDDWKPGFAVVLNATPSFLQFATGGSAPTGGKQ